MSTTQYQPIEIKVEEVNDRLPQQQPFTIYKSCVIPVILFIIQAFMLILQLILFVLAIAVIFLLFIAFLIIVDLTTYFLNQLVKFIFIQVGYFILTHLLENGGH